MSTTINFLSLCIFFMLLISQKEKDTCLIISLKDNNEFYRMGTIGNYDDQFYLYLKYRNSQKNKEYKNPLINFPVKKYLAGVSFNLENKQKLKNLPEGADKCNCASVEKFNLGMEFKLYIEKEDSWVAFNAKKLLVEE